MTTVSDPPSDRSPPSTLATLHRQARYTRWFRKHLAATLLVFFASGLAGYAVGDALAVEAITELAPDESVLPELEFVPIALNNLRVLFLVLAGTITFGLISLFVLFFNGLVIGVVVGLAGQEVPLAVVFAALLPHGILELPAFFAAGAIGLRVPHRVGRFLLGWDETPLTRVELYELVVLTVVLVVAIVVAAWIEVNVTPEVIEWIGGSDALPDV